MLLTLSRFVGNGFRRFGCSQGGPTTCQSWTKTHGKNHPKTPKPLPTKRESVTNISEEPHVGALLTCLLERTLPFETKAIYAIVKFFFFLVFEKRRETAPVSNESLRFENHVGNKPTSKSVPSEVAFWRYPCNGFGDARQSSQRAWVPKALWRYVCRRFFDSSFNFGLRSEPKPLTRNP